MVQRNVEQPVRFVCMTDDATHLRAEIDSLPLPEFPEPAWEYARFCSAWRKLALFDATNLALHGRILFLDLDVVILRSLEPFFSAPSLFLMLENWYQPGKGQASIMCFEGDSMKPLLSHYLNNSEDVLKHYVTEQEYISQNAAEVIGVNESLFFDSRLCMSFKKHIMRHGIQRFSKRPYSLPPKAHVVVFHGRPNPPDALLGEWGKPMPALKRWWKGLQPCPWIADYWCE